MSNNNILQLPQQQIPMSKKNKKWKESHLDWADSKSFFNNSPIRSSIMNKKINYDLINGKVHMSDIERIMNPGGTTIEGVKMQPIQHYPIINSKLNVLRGEESRRLFDYRVVVTNPNALSEREENKKNEVFDALKKLVSDQSISEDEYNDRLSKMSDFFTYEWQDMREIRANCLLKHYWTEYNMPLIFNSGFMDALTISEEIYQCDIRGGEPIIERVNPLKIKVFRSGYSNKIEDADIITIEDYWSPAKIIDSYYDVLTKKDREYIEGSIDGDSSNSPYDDDSNDSFINRDLVLDSEDSAEVLFDPMGSDNIDNQLVPFDTFGNIRVIRMYWKSRRMIKKVKSYDPKTGEEVFDFYDESYVIDETKGEEEWIYYINEAWEGTKIGDSVYVNIRPRPIRYNRMSNPSRCHFGIIGSIYNINDEKPLSLVDMAKPFSYLYDITHDRLNKMMAHNWGKIVTLDLAKVPKNWTIDKWMYYAKMNNLAVVDSFKEGNIGSASGVLAGGLNNASSGVIDAELGNTIQNYINTLEFIKMEVSDIMGISKQREGQISNRETVGGVERSTLQSSLITEYIYLIHDDVKKRAIECFLETAKIALRGRKETFQYKLSDGALKVMDVEGDEFAEADYGIVVDTSNRTQDLNQQLDQLSLAAMQGQKITFSTLMKIYSSISLSEKQRLVEKDEKDMEARESQAQQQQMQQQQQQVEMQLQMKDKELQMKDQQNARDNETKLMIAQLSSEQNDGIQESEYSPKDKEKLLEDIREFDERLKFDRDKLEVEKSKIRTTSSSK